ncbi:hypothetical protein Csa_002289 [Cucumis sativus]|nr:hypothetical protein Csa_002289 [Cucumis sativus]
MALLSPVSHAQVSFLIGFVTTVVAWAYSEYLAFKKQSISSQMHVDVGLSTGEESHNVKEDDKAVLLEGNVMKSTPSGATISSTFSTVIRVTIEICSSSSLLLIIVSTVIFLMYHYFDAREICNMGRVCIASYIWMTGFGNFSYYYARKDFSNISRFAQVTLLPISIIPSNLIRTSQFRHGYKDPNRLKENLPLMYEWHFRTGLDRYIWILGMMYAYYYSTAMYLWFEYVIKMDSLTYNKFHPYTSWIPITSNAPDAQPKLLLTIIPDYPILNFMLTTTIFIMSSYRISELTNTFKMVFVPSKDNKRIMYTMIAGATIMAVLYSSFFFLKLAQILVIEAKSQICSSREVYVKGRSMTISLDLNVFA